MSTGKSLVVLDVQPQPGRRRSHDAVLLLLAVAGLLTGLASFVAMLTFVSPGRGIVVASERDDAARVPTIAVAPVVVAQPWQETPFPIHITPPGAKRGSYLEIDGLPALAMLSEGHATRPGSWRVPVDKLATLKITSPATEDAKLRLAITLVSPDGVVLSEARPLLAVVKPEHIGPHSVVRPLALPMAAPATRCSSPAAPAERAELAPVWGWPGARQEAAFLVRGGDDARSRGSVVPAHQI